jgi:hypothetical protein
MEQELEELSGLELSRSAHTPPGHYDSSTMATTASTEPMITTVPRRLGIRLDTMRHWIWHGLRCYVSSARLYGARTLAGSDD